MLRRILAIMSLVCCMASTCTADDVDIYIAAGQSNMDGRSSVSDLPSNSSFRSTQSNAIIWYSNPGEPGTSEPDFSSNGWRSLRTGYSVEAGFSGSLPSDTFGPEVSFVNEIRNETGSQNEIGIIKISKGGTSIRESRGEWHGNPNDNPGYMFDELIEEVDRALDALAARGDRGIIRGMIWHQGEADRSFRFYTANLDELIDAVRDEFGSNLPIVVGELSRDRSDNATFNANLDDFVDESSNLGLVSSSGLDTFDTTHFDADDTVVLGQRFARELGPMVGTISTPTPSEPESPFIDLNGDFRDGLSGWTIEDGRIDLSSRGHDDDISARLRSSDARLTRRVTVLRNTNYRLRGRIETNGRFGYELGGNRVSSTASGAARNFKRRTFEFNTGNNDSITIFCEWRTRTGRFDSITLENRD